MPSSHKIKSVLLDLQWNGRNAGFESQQLARDWWETLAPELEKELDKLAGEGTFLRIEELEVYIKVNGEHWEQEALNEVCKAIREKVRAKQLEQINYKQLVHFPKNESGQDTSNAGKETPIDFESSEYLDVFLYFLQFGYLPWNAELGSTHGWQIIKQKVIERLNGKEHFQKLVALLKISDTAKLRAMKEFSISTFIQIFSAQKSLAGPEAQLVLEDFIRISSAIPDRKPTTKRAEELFGALVLNALLGSQTEYYRINQWVIEIQEKKEKSNGGEEKTIGDWLGYIADKNHPFASQFFTTLQTHISGIKNETDFSKEITIQKKKVKNHEGIIPGKKEKELSFPNQLTHADDEEKSVRDGIFISNAGLVIAAPFLPMLFKNLGWWDNHILNNKDSAVCLVHYLATGTTNMEEYELVLPKLLCGLEPEEVVDTLSFSQNAAMTKEAGELLQSLIEYWSVLKDTSVEGLRGSFLLREGKLIQNGKDWKLLVAQAPYDMLLHQLPWNISMLELPWMQGILYTDWVY